MITSLKNITAFLVVLSFQLYANKPEAVTTTSQDITLTARALSKEECLETFCKNMHNERVYPITLSIDNQSKKAVVIKKDGITVAGTTVLTPRSLDSKISALKVATTALVFVFFPFSLITAYDLAKFEELAPIIQRFSFDDTSTIVIQPSENFETMVFALVDYPKDIDGKSQPFFLPQHLMLSIDLKSDYCSLYVPTPGK